MKISAWIYICFWTYISYTFLDIGYTLSSDHPSEHIKVSLSIIFTFISQLLLTLSVSHSAVYAVARHRDAISINKSEYPKDPLKEWRVIINIGIVYMVVNLSTRKGSNLILNFINVTTSSRIGWVGALSFQVILCMITITTGIVASWMTKVELSFPNSFSIPEFFWRKGTVLRYAPPLLGSVLFQYYVKFTSSSQVFAFLFFAAAWLCCIALHVPFRGDLGVLDFMLVNLSLSCTVNDRLGLTWIAYGVCVFLFCLHRRLDGVNFIDHDNWAVVFIPSLCDQFRDLYLVKRIRSLKSCRENDMLDPVISLPV